MVDNWSIKTLEGIDQLEEVEGLQRIVWPGSETDVVPAHLLITAVHNGGFAIGAYPADDAGQPGGPMVGFAFSFPGLYSTPDGPRLKHCSHMLAVHPEFRGKGLGFRLKRAQWQMVRHQGIDRITWTYDPLLSRNAHLNITLLGAVCSTYKREVYGEMRDGLNVGLPSDRFEVDWWVNSQRVRVRLGKRARPRLALENILAAGAEIINPAQLDAKGWVTPSNIAPPDLEYSLQDPLPSILLAEIPSDFLALKNMDMDLAKAWRLTTRSLFEELFSHGYLVTDFVYQPGESPRSYYVFSHGDGTL